MRRRGRRRSKRRREAESEPEETKEEGTEEKTEEKEEKKEGEEEKGEKEDTSEGKDKTAESDAEQTGQEKKDEKEEKDDAPTIMKKEGLLAQLFEWESEGYDTSALEEAVQSNAPDIDKKFEEYKENVEKLKGIVKKMEEIEVDERLMDDIQKIRDMMNNPYKVWEIEEALKKLENKTGMRKYLDEIESMNTEGMEKEVQEIKDLMTDPANVPQIEKKIADLKRMVKERFFESEIALSFKPKPKKKVRKIKIVKTKVGMKAAPFKIHDIFLFHHKGDLISHHTRRSDLGASKSQIASMIKLIQSNVKSGKRKDIKRIEFENYRLLFQDGANVTLTAVITGQERNEMFLLMKKVNNLIEKKFANQLKTWPGEGGGKLPGVDKYMAALIQVLIKMELKAGKGGKKKAATGRPQPRRPAPPAPKE